MKKQIYVYLAFIIPIILSIIVHIYGFPRAKAEHDQFKQYDDMREYYDNGVITPPVGTKMWAAYTDNTPRMPGGFFYFLYSNLYRIASANFDMTRILFMFLCIATLIIFLYWFYKRFGLYLTAFITAFLACNAYLFFASIDIYNPNIVIYLSFIFLILFSEYVSDSKYSYVSALFLFPVLALMAQCHFALFFSMVPALIVYHIVRFKSLTKKYIIPLAISIFISFLTYLPYLISEINNGFQNTLSMLAFREGEKFIGIPQIYSMFLFPTTEISIFYGRTNAILTFWFKNNPFIMIFGIIMLLATAVFSITAFVFSIRKIFSKKYKEIEFSNKTDIMLRESMILYLIYIPTTLIIFFIAKSKSGTFHYLYNVFALCFIPSIIFAKYIFENKGTKIKNALLIFAIVTSIAFSLQITRAIKLFHAPYTYERQREVINSIINDADGREFDINTPLYREIMINLYRLAAKKYEIKDWNYNGESSLIYFIYLKEMYLFNGKWSDVKDNKNIPVPENAVKIYGNDDLAVYRY